MKNWWILKSYHWLKSGDIKGETESRVVAAQDQATSTNYFKNKILKEEIETRYNNLKQERENVHTDRCGNTQTKMSCKRKRKRS
jgi:hypothetical protein